MIEHTETIKQIIEQLINKMGFEAQVSIGDSSDQNIAINIQTDEAGYLIGQAGANLQALQHLARILVNKKIINQGLPIQFIVDINDYKKNRFDLLKELALNMAKQAIEERVSLSLQPMPAYERRIIHLALAGHPDVYTESIGQGELRRVAIKIK